MGRDIKQYIRGWEKEKSQTTKIHVAAIADESYVYGIEVRFSATMYELTKDAFKSMVDTVNRKSGGCLKIYSSYDEFHSGIISMNVAFCNHGYSGRKVIDTLRFLFTDVLPDLKK